MQSNEHMTDHSDHRRAPGSPMLYHALICGVISGTASNITALLLGYSFWAGLLCHSLVGMLGMLLVIAAYSMRSEKPEGNSAP